MAHAIVLAVTNEHVTGKIYNVGEAEALTEAERVRRMGEAAGWSGEILPVAREELPAHLREDYDWNQHWVVDTRRIRAELGYVGPVAREEALRRTVDWARAHPPQQVDASRFDYAAEDAAME